MGAWGFDVFANDSMMDVVGHTVDKFFTENEKNHLIECLEKLAPKERYVEGLINDSFLIGYQNTSQKLLHDTVYQFTLNLGKKEIQKRIDNMAYGYDPDVYLLDIFKISFKVCLNYQCTHLELSKYLSSMGQYFDEAKTYNDVEARKLELIKFNNTVMEHQNVSINKLEKIIQLFQNNTKNNSSSFKDNELVEQFKSYYEKTHLDANIFSLENSSKKLKI